MTENWFSNENSKLRDLHIKEAFKQTESKLDKRSRIDAMFSGTTCVIVYFDNNQIVCANSGDSRAILISQQDQTNNNRAFIAGGLNEFNDQNKYDRYIYTQLSRDHKPDLPDEAQRIIKKNGRIEPSKVSADLIYGQIHRLP